MKKNVFITGATGFIGSHIALRFLREDGYNVYCLARSPKKALKLQKAGARIIYGDITNPDLTLEKIDFPLHIIIHSAAVVGNRNKTKLNDVNVKGTENVCAFALKKNIEKMIYISSTAVATGNPQVPLTEELPYSATTPYGESKIKAEKIVIDYRNKGLDVIILRPPIVYGEGEPHFMRTLIFMMNLRLFCLVDGGKRKFHMVYVKNIAELIFYSLNRTEFLKGTFFIADKDVLTAKEIFNAIAKGAGFSAPWRLPGVLQKILLCLPVLKKGARFFMKDREYSINRLKALGFTPSYGALESLKKSAGEYKNGK